MNESMARAAAGRCAGCDLCNAPSQGQKSGLMFNLSFTYQVM